MLIKIDIEVVEINKGIEIKSGITEICTAMASIKNLNVMGLMLKLLLSDKCNLETFLLCRFLHLSKLDVHA
ncbi:MAG: hypothetical protein ACI9GM_000612 [Salibacteraceae bacterium]|jgi:hypothetical protein